MNTLRSLIPLTFAVALLTGCSNAEAPAGPGNDAAVTDVLKGMSKEEKIKFYKNSPLPPDQKAAKLKELGAEPDIATSSGSGVPGH